MDQSPNIGVESFKGTNEYPKRTAQGLDAFRRRPDGQGAPRLAMSGFAPFTTTSVAVPSTSTVTYLAAASTLDRAEGAATHSQCRQHESRAIAVSAGSPKAGATSSPNSNKGQAATMPMETEMANKRTNEATLAKKDSLRSTRVPTGELVTI